MDKIFEFMSSGQYDIASQLLKGIGVSQQLLKKLVEKSVLYQIKNNKYEYSKFANDYFIKIGNCLFIYGIHCNNSWFGSCNPTIENCFLCLKYEVVAEELPDFAFMGNKEYKQYRRKLKKYRCIVKKPSNFGIYRKIIKGIASAIIKEYHIC